MEGNHTVLLLEYGKGISKALLPIDILLSIVLVAGILGNVFVIFIFATKMRQDKRGSRYFIPVLAVCDLMVCIVALVHYASNTLFWTSFQSDRLCKTLMFFLVQTMMTSDGFLLAIAVQRFIKICRPTAKQMTLYWRRVTSVLVIVANTLYSIPTAVVSGVQDSTVVYKNVNISGEGCGTANNQYPLFQLIYYSGVMFILIANIVVTAGLYTPIALVIYRRFRRRHIQHSAGVNISSVEGSGISTTSCKTPFSTGKEDDSAQMTREISKRDRQSKTNFNKMFFVIISAYVVSYVPTAVMLTYGTIDDTIWTSSYEELRLYVFLIRTYVFNHAANPFIYAYFDSEIRSNIKLQCSM